MTIKTKISYGCFTGFFENYTCFVKSDMLIFIQTNVRINEREGLSFEIFTFSRPSYRKES